MATSPNCYRAFRVFGDFQWPFVGADFDKPGSDTAANRLGIVEIYYSEVEAKIWSAFLRWIPKKAFAGNLPEPFSADDLKLALDIQVQTDQQLKDAFAGDKTTLFQLAGTKKKPPRDRHLLFRGAFLFDQFAPGEKGEKHDLRWALARTFSQAGTTYFSEVVIGQKSDDAAFGSRIRFNLALPSPGAQSGTSANHCYALPFAAIFKGLQTAEKPIIVPVGNDSSPARAKACTTGMAFLSPTRSWRTSGSAISVSAARTEAPNSCSFRETLPRTLTAIG